MICVSLRDVELIKECIVKDCMVLSIEIYWVLKKDGVSFGLIIIKWVIVVSGYIYLKLRYG